MATYKNKQRFLIHRGREFHFVSYEGHAADVAKQIAAAPPTWFLIASGKRWAAMPLDERESDEECERRLADWLDRNVFAA